MNILSEKEKLELYKKVIKTPYQKEGYTWHEVEFRSLYELYNYLSSNPEINSKIFRNSSSTIPLSKLPNFFEMEYEEAVECLLGKYNKNVDKLLELKKNLSNTIYFPSSRRKVIKSFTGSRICPNSFVANNPKRYYKLERTLERKFITLHVNLSYSGETTTTKILNRGALIYNLVNMLEENNYSVELDTFFLLRESEEIAYIKVRLKNINEKFSIQNGVFPLISRDFLRRIIFRVIETLKLEDSKWGTKYGSYIKDVEAMQLLAIKENDIYIPSPDDLGIEGVNLSDDIDNFLDYINIKRYVKITRR